MGYTTVQINQILAKADRTMYKIGSVAYQNMFSELDEALDYHRDIIYIYKKAVEWGDDYFVGTEKLDKIVERLAGMIAVWDYGMLTPIYTDVSGVEISALPPCLFLVDLCDVNITNVQDKQYLTYDEETGKWINTGPGAAIRYAQSLTATAGQTVFVTANPFTVGFFDLYLNGVRLNTASFTTFGNYSITLIDPCSAGDILDVVTYDINSSISSYIVLTTAGSTGASTLTGTILNIPNYGLESISTASVTGTTTKTLTLTKLSGDTITASWIDNNTDAVTSVFGRTGDVLAQSGDYTTTLVTEGTNLYYTDTRARAAISLTTIGTSGAATYIGGVLNIPQYQSVLTNPVTGTGTTNYVTKWTSSSSIGNSLIYDNGTNVLINKTSDNSFGKLQVNGGSYFTGNMYIETSANPTQFMLRGTNPEFWFDGAYGGGTSRILINRAGTGNQSTIVFTTGATITKGVAWDGGNGNWAMGITNNNDPNALKFGVGDIYNPSSVMLTFTTDQVATFKNTPYVGTYYIYHQGNLTLSTLGGVPTTRTLTINGTTYDLSSDRTWSVGTVTSVAALTLGTSGTDLSSTVVTGTTTPVITLNVPTASATNRGALSSFDWTTFNGKQDVITLTTTGTSGPATFIGNVLNVPQYEAEGNYALASTTLTINGTTYDLSANRSWSVGTVTSVGLSMPTAFTVSNSPITGAGTINVTGAGTATQYIRGDGQLATFPSNAGGGSSVNYYLNGSITASVAGYKQMDNTAIIGGGTDFTLSGNGLIAQFLTDVGNPNRIQIPGGAWNFEMYFNSSSNGGAEGFYIELHKYDGSVFTLIASSIGTPESISNGTSTDLYLTSLAVPTTTLLTTDRLAIRVYIVNNAGARTITLHTENNTLCEIITTFAGGVSSLNGLTANTQYLAVGTSGTDFNINSLVDTHTFNLPTASAINRGALSTADWSTFNSKQNAITLTTTGTSGAATLVGATLNIPQYQSVLTNPVTGTGTANEITYWTSSNAIGSLTTATYPSLTELSYVKGITSSVQTQLNAKQGTITLTTNGIAGASTLISNTLNIPNYGAISDGVVSGGIVTWTGTGLIFTVSACNYYINDVNYNSPLTTITLDPADPSFDRIDVFAVNTSSQVVVIKGTPALNPAEPEGDTNTTLGLTNVTVTAGATTPNQAVRNLIYDENVESWTQAITGGIGFSYNNVDTTQSYTPTKSFKVIQGTQFAQLRFSKAISMDVRDYKSLSFAIRLNAAWTTQQFQVSFYNGSTRTALYSITSTNTVGFNRALANQWQFLTINLALFTFSSNAFTSVQIYTSGSNTTYWIDTVSLNGGITSPVGPSVTSITALSPLTGGTITSSGSIGISQSSATTNGYLSSTDWNTFNSKQSNITLTTIGDSGAATFTANTLNIPNYAVNPAARNENTFTATAGQTTFSATYTVGQLDVYYNGSKLAPAEFSATNGTSVVLAISCLANDIVNIISYVTGSISGVSGTTNYVAKFTGTTTVGNSLIYDNGTNVGIGITSPAAKLDVNGTGNFSSSVTAASLIKSGGTSAQILAADGSVITAGTNITISGGTISASGGAMAIGGSITSATVGSVLFAGTSGVLQQDNANFFWDDTNNRLGIGNNTPKSYSSLTVTGQIVADSNICLNFGQSLRMNMYYNASPSEDRAMATGYSGDFVLNAATGDWKIRTTTASALANATITTMTDRLTISAAGVSTFYDNVVVSKNQNASTIFNVSNTTSGTLSIAILRATSDASAGTFEMGKFSATSNAYKILSSNVGYLYNGIAGDIAILNDFASGSIKFAAGGSSTAQLTILNNGNITQTVNQNAATIRIISNTTSGTGSQALLQLTSDASSGSGQVGKFSTTTTPYKILASKDTYIYNGTVAGDIAILNDFATGQIKLAAGGSSTAHMTIASTGAATFSSSVTARSATTAASVVPAFLGANEFMSTGSLAGFFMENRSGGVTSTTNWAGWYYSGTAVRMYNGSSDILSIVASTGQLKLNNYTSTAAFTGTAVGYLGFDASGNILSSVAPSGGGSTIVLNRQAASYTLVLADAGKLVEMNVASANNLTIPLNSSVAFPTGTTIDVSQYGAGQTTFVATAGVTIRSTNGWLKMNAQYGAATLVKIGTDEWYLFGNINA